MGKMKRRGIVGTIAALMVIFVAMGLDNGLRVREYTVAGARAGEPVRLALISDLHSCRYGEGMEELTRAVAEQAPDVIVLVGDIFDDQLADDNAAAFLSAAARLCPCLYVTGNHEYWSGNAAFAEKMRILEECGVERLDSGTRTMTIRGQTIVFYGLDDPDGGKSIGEQLTGLEAARTGDGYEVLLSHRPEYAEVYAAAGFDLVLCGHAHGGQWRIPGILNGVFAPDQGLFPRYAGGRYDINDTVMIVGRGLSRESTPVPRWYNPPEIVIVNLIKRN